MTNLHKKKIAGITVPEYISYGTNPPPLFNVLVAGFSDPFVIVELLPKSMFPYTAEQYTDVKKKTLNPLFDECFEL